MSVTIIFCIIIFLASNQAFRNQELLHKLAHYPMLEYKNKEYYRWLTSMFVHANFTHLLVNLFVFWSFGTFVEQVFKSVFGSGTGLVLYIVLIAFSAVVSDLPTYFKHKENPNYLALGASGVTSAIVFVSIFFNPWQNLYLFAVLPIPGILFGIAYVAYESYASKKGNDNIGHSAHLYGALAGIIFIIATYPKSATLFLEKLIEGLPFIN